MAANALMNEPEARPADASGWMHPRAEVRTAGARLLDADADLARRLDPVVRERLAPLLRVRIEAIDTGRWRPTAFRGDPANLGLLVLDGLLLRDLSVSGRCCAELIGPGDLLRPDDEDDPDATVVPAELEWQVVDGPVRVALLDARATALIGRFPPLMTELVDRTIGRARSLQFQLALTQVNGIGKRIELLLWRLADRWGHVTPEGVVLPVNLTHEMVGRLIGARRPSVTTAFRRLEEEGLLTRRRDGWVLQRDEGTVGVSA